MTCTECGSSSLQGTSLPGMVKCLVCGNVMVGKIDPGEIPEVGPGQNLGEVPIPATPEGFAPDSIEVEVGWRTWEVKIENPPGVTPLMRSVTHREFHWTPREPMVAHCPLSTGRANGVKRQGHDVPDEGCSCGLYTAKTYEHLMTMHYHTYDGEKDGYVNVVGEVKLWGKVIEGTQGWRSSHAYPKRIYIPYEYFGKLAKPLGDGYGVPVAPKNFLGRSLPQATKGK